jgi:hypothetical protein
VGGWGNSSFKAFGISFADRPKAKRSNEGYSIHIVVKQNMLGFIHETHIVGCSISNMETKDFLPTRIPQRKLCSPAALSHYNDVVPLKVV